MAVKLSSYCLEGLSVLPVSVEVDVRRGMPHFSIIGMAGKSVREAADRVRSAISHSGFEFPLTRKIVNLAPADLAKSGTHFDVAMALGILVASKQIPEIPKDVWTIGELGLEGDVRPVRGVLPALMFAKKVGLKEVVLPRENLREASYVDGLKLVPVDTLSDVISHFNGKPINPVSLSVLFEAGRPEMDFASISGHSAVKRALVVAAAGGHHMLMRGSPGTGKSLLARAFPGILPKLKPDELLEVLMISSISGNSCGGSVNRPFHTVHQSLTPVGMIGGGPSLKPGAVTLAHKGVLFMDEFPEFSREVIELLRQPLEEGRIQLSRTNRQVEYPCNFQLLAAMNPCPCGYFGDKEKQCMCSAAQLAGYRSKISGPILDRIDIQIEVPRIGFEELGADGGAESSREMVEQVQKAREFGLTRGNAGANANMKSSEVKAEKMDANCHELLKRTADFHALSGRAIHKIIKVARTIADLDGSGEILAAHLSEAIMYRVR